MTKIASALRTRATVCCCAVIALSSSRAVRADVTIGVESAAAQFSPGTWSGDRWRGGSISRTTWNNGAWFSFVWSSASDMPKATLAITNQTPGSAISYYIDGELIDNVPVPAQGGITITGLSGAGPHTLMVYTRNSAQTDRWQGRNAYTVRSLTVEDGATPGYAAPLRPWVLIIGDSITEGIQADNGRDSSLSDYSFLLGQGLRAAGYDYAVSACGYSGWIQPGDAKGDVPGYYPVHGGIRDDENSRWNRIDARNSLLDARGHISAYGGISEEPAAIVFNYMVNEALHGTPLADAEESVTTAISAVRRAAPNAFIFILVPPGLQNTRVYPRGVGYIDALQAGITAYRMRHSSDNRIAMVDLGPDVANALASAPYGGGVHPHAAGHAFIAVQVLPLLLSQLEARQLPVRR